MYRANHPLLDVNPELFFRTSVYIPVIDAVLNDLRNRLPEDVLDSFDLRLLMPASIDSQGLQNTENTYKIKQRIKKLSEVYRSALGEYAISLKSEFNVWLEKWQLVTASNQREWQK